MADGLGLACGAQLHQVRKSQDGSWRRPIRDHTDMDPAGAAPIVEYDRPRRLQAFGWWAPVAVLKGEGLMSMRLPVG